ncbi:MAG: NfeD family protein [Bacilli bacterium]|jgi:membrane protein implicated in regulation of membrane protease activity|nr:NfeD family protein [Bacilli bacterium]
MDQNTIMLIVWLSVFVLALIVEISTDMLVSVWFCIGALVALGVTYIPGTPLWVEILVFFAVTIISLIALRPLAKKLLFRNKSQTNIDEIIGKKGKVIKKITELDNGEVKINGVIWTAMKMADADEILEETVVEVVAVNGNKLVVKEYIH